MTATMTGSDILRFRARQNPQNEVAYHAFMEKTENRSSGKFSAAAAGIKATAIRSTATARLGSIGKRVKGRVQGDVVLALTADLNQQTLHQTAALADAFPAAFPA
jgi:hypothetical protein